MLYLDFWTNYWKNIAELASGGQQETEKPSPESSAPEEAFSSKEKYEYLTEYGTQILCLLTPKDGCSYLSRNFEALTGNSDASSFGNQFFEMVHADFRDRLAELLAEKSNKKGKPVAFRCKLKHGDEKWYWYLFLIHGKHSADSSEIVCVMENVHDSIQIQGSLQKAKLEAELALRSRSEFLANMSHDLRTPLNAVIGFAQIIDSQMFGKIENPQYLEYAKHIQESGYDLLSKIEDLLEISNIEAGRVSLEREEVALSDLLKNSIETQLHHASAAGVKVNYRSCSRDALLNVDRVKLQHIISHLVTNAIRHCEEGGQVELSADIAGNGELVLQVSDNGAGMTRAKLEGIRSALKEEASWSAKCNNGTGLGLALTKEFVALHGGMVEIDSKASSGTIVTITLPAECIRAYTQETQQQLLLAVR